MLMSYYQLPPKSAFPHTFEYKNKSGEDNYHKPIYDPSKTIENVWFNLASTFSRSGNNSTEKAPNSSVTLLYRYCGLLPDFTNDSLVIFEGKEYKIVLVKELILNGESIGWRLEVV
ncbi:hypothetical protein DXX97_05885 [Lactococcus lactis]|nr:hypothetical protein [Lactococcus lactis]